MNQFYDYTIERIKRRVRGRLTEFMHKDPNLEKVVIFGGVLYLGNRLINTMMRSHKAKEEQRRRNRRVYDQRAHHWVTARRDLTVAEWREYDRRYRNGENASDIFASMGLR